MSWQLSQTAWEIFDIGRGEKSVLLCLAQHAGDNGKCWPGIPRIAKYCRMSQQGVRNCIKKLEAQGFIHVDRKTKAHKSNDYHVLPNRDTLTQGSTECTPTVSVGTPSSECRVTPTVSVPESVSEPVKEASSVGTEVSALQSNPEGGEADSAQPPDSHKCEEALSASRIDEAADPPPSEGKTRKSKPRTAQPRETWMTAYDLPWFGRTGGHLPFSQCAKGFKQLETDHGSDKVLEAWKRYLRDTKDDYISPHAFIRKPGIQTVKPKNPAIIDMSYTNW